MSMYFYEGGGPANSLPMHLMRRRHRWHRRGGGACEAHRGGPDLRFFWALFSNWKWGARLLPQQWRRPEVVDATAGGAHNLTATSAAQAWPERGKATHTECVECLEEQWEAERCEEI
jgi:hypothetical protein